MKKTHAKTPRRKEAETAADFPGFGDLDRHFARFIGRFGGGELAALAAAHLSRAVGRGHICLDLSVPPQDEPDRAPGEWPSLEAWRKALGASRAVASPEDDALTPLVLDAAGRLYLRRYFNDEAALAEALRRRAVSGGSAALAGSQEEAVALALANRLTILSGGPGTGKTTTVVRFLEALMPPGAPLVRLGLAAPTGKAAARMEEALRDGLARAGRPELLAALPRAATLHRLLGVRRNMPGFRHHAGNPLALDYLVVDEASMVPLPMMASLLDALPASARLLLLGDRDQLASVDPGSVLADLVDAALLPNGPLRGTLAVLKKNFRFGNDNAIYRLAEAVREGRAAEALALLVAPGGEALAGAPLPPPARLREALREPVLAGYRCYCAERDPARALEAFGRFRLLCAVRKGPYGVEELNRHAEALLREAGQLHGEPPLCAGMPLLITRNDPQLGLFNGDIGLILPDPEQPEGPLWAWFPGDGEAPALRRFAPGQLPEHEPAFAMTVHKSQGSEFDEVLLILPERETPVVTRELIYTGLTRARRRVGLWSEPSVFGQGIARRIRRDSGLRDRLI